MADVFGRIVGAALWQEDGLSVQWGAKLNLHVTAFAVDSDGCVHHNMLNVGHRTAAGDLELNEA